MPTIRKVPEYYATFVEAVTAAQTGDVILLSAGTHETVNSVRINKWIHIKGETEDPLNDPVILRATSGTTNDGVFGFYHTQVDPCLVEGIWIDGNIEHLYSTTTSAVHGPVLFNRCLFQSKYCHFRHEVTPGVNNYYQLEFRNCTEAPGEGTGWYRDITTYDKFDFRKCRFNDAPSVCLNATLPTSTFFDMVFVDTEEYGVNYGSFLYEQYVGQPFRIAGLADIEGTTPDQVQVQLFVADTLGMQRTSWTVTTPDPTTGEWSFDYLPTDKTYYVALVPPEGYRPKLIGPYTPVQS